MLEKLYFLLGKSKEKQKLWNNNKQNKNNNKSLNSAVIGYECLYYKN